MDPANESAQVLMPEQDHATDKTFEELAAEEEEDDEDESAMVEII